MNDAAADLVPECPPSRNRLYLKLTIGRTNESLAGLSNPVDSSLIGKAYDFYRQVIDEATISGDTLAAAYGYGLIGHLYEMEGAAGREDAIKATRAAVFRSSSSDAASLYRWQWQMGRLLDAEGKATMRSARCFARSRRWARRRARFPRAGETSDIAGVEMKRAVSRSGRHAFAAGASPAL